MHKASGFNTFQKEDQGVRDKGISKHRPVGHLESNVDHQFHAAACREISEFNPDVSEHMEIISVKMQNHEMLYCPCSKQHYFNIFTISVTPALSVSQPG